MRRNLLYFLLISLSVVLFLSRAVTTAQEKAPGAKPDFDMTASYIEACSCDMFCPCYFNTHSTHHGHDHFCRANLVLKVDKGHYKKTKLDGAKVWIATDLGSEWSTGKDSWAVLNYDPSVTPEQKTALNDIIGQPVARGVDRELSLLEPIQSAATGANPQRTIGVLMKRNHYPARESVTRRISRKLLVLKFA